MKDYPLSLFTAPIGRLWLVVAACLWVGCSRQLPPEVATAYAELPETISFNFHVKPILSDKCFACHGPDAAALKAELRLDTPEGAYAALKDQPGHYAVVPYKAHRSEVYHRITATDTARIMPPPESHLALDPREIAILTKWIEQGAVYEAHWSFIPPAEAPVPAVSDAAWTRNEIDHFVLERLEQEGLPPNEEADKRTLIRRLSFGLTGLPPSLTEIDEFLTDTLPGAYERLVERLLASPDYGERMAADWMDVARYADSDGYLDDKHREFSPWRDWVIDAFNENMPYEQFVTWQLAGDLLEDAPKEAVLATAFNRLHRKNSEAGIVFEEYRQEYVADRTNTLGKAFLGLTMECARCHDHKYDPISQKDYYRSFAFFNSTHEMGSAVYGPDQTPGPAMLLTNGRQDSIIAFLEKTIERQQREMEQLQISAGFAQWLQDESGILAELQRQSRKELAAHLPFDELRPVDGPFFRTSNQAGGREVQVKEGLSRPGLRGNALFFSTYTGLKLPDKIGWFEQTDPFSVSLAIYPDTLYPEAGVFYHCEDIRLGYKGYSMHLEDNHLKFIIAHSYPQNAIQVRTKKPLPPKAWTHITLTYDGSSRASGIRLYWNGEAVPLTVDYDHLYKGILFQPDIHTYGFAGFQLGERNFIKNLRGGGIDELKIYRRELSPLEAGYQYDPKAVLSQLRDTADPSLRTAAARHYQLHHDPDLQNRRLELQALRSKLNDTLNKIPEIMVMGDLPEPRPTFVQERGLYSAPGEAVEPGVPDAILPWSDQWPKNRLGLSRWLFHPDHPLTARVFVNRIWQMHFGRGLVATADDFGSQGALPTHPELLDWLAVYFRESGWDIKALHRKIVLSATYRQSSRVDPLLLDKDPGNELLARGPSFRLSAEMIRDQALQVSELLVDRRGGPSVYPYQPSGLWDEISNKIWRYPYLQEAGEGLYRRSLYTIFKRTSPPPAMLIFDAPDRSTCTVRRTQTSTPLQALVLLNDPQYIEAARVLAENLWNGHGGERSLILRKGFELLTGRDPDREEISVLLTFYQEELARFTDEQEQAKAYLAVGEQPADTNLTPESMAALATVLHGIMNTADSYTLR